MSGRSIEGAASLAALLLLSGMVVSEGRTRVALERRLPMAPKDLYRAMARPGASLQVLDVRPDLAEGYEEARIPGALPFPGCDPAQAPEAARRRIDMTVPTVVVSSGSEPLGACLARFSAARGLEGGMEAWSDANLPEDSGEYTPPSAKAGGGCL